MSGDVQPTPLHRAILDAWGSLLRSREGILRRHYADSTKALGVDLPLDETLEEVRERYYKTQLGQWPPDLFVDEAESKIVLGTKIIAAWVVFWSTLLPCSLLSWLCVDRIRGMQEGIMPWLIFIPITFGILFLPLAFVCLFIQSLLVGPFNALLGRVLGTTGRAPSPPPEE
jgi:hypothetical protein